MMSDADQAGGRTRARAIEDHDMDMTGVDPLRLAEVRRRVAVVKSFIALTEPTDADRKTHAMELRLSVNQFLALVRAWREHGRAVAISCAGAAKGTPRPNGRRNLPVASKAAAQEVIATLGPEVSLVETVRRVREKCGAIRVAAPSRNTIWNMLMAHRRAGGATGRKGVVVCRCHVRLPVATATGVDFPEIAIAVDLSDGIILAATLDGDRASAAHVVSAARRRSGGQPVPIDEDIVLLAGASAHTRVRPVKGTAARAMVASVLGRGFGTLDLIYRRSLSIDPAALLRSRKDAPVDPEDARRVIAEQLIRHNAARGAKPPVWLTAGKAVPAVGSVPPAAAR
jgi:hypothetical protein